MTGAPANIADTLRARAREAPVRIAMYLHSGVAVRNLSYAELDRGSDEIAAGLHAIGLAPGMRAALMVRPSPEFFLLMFALFKAGVAPVLIDPGIDKRALKQCLEEAAPQAFIGIPLAQVARVLLGWARRHVRVVVTVGRRWLWGGHTLHAVRALGRGRVPPATQSDIAAILFTSGSTGVPKGVVYTHAQMLAQVDLIRRAFAIRAGEIDLATFPPFALFDPGLGMTSVIPDMDPTRPASAEPEKLMAAIAQHGCTSLFGSPALLDTLSRYAERHAVRLGTVRRVLSAGAPVRPDIIARTYAMLPADAEVWTPYGATECLPVAIIEGREVLAVARERTAEGGGICVGRPLAENTVRIIRIDDAPIACWHDDLLCAPGEIGEITVRGPTVTTRYFGRDAATVLAKIDERGAIVHRMGDLGYVDDQGRLWFVGRKSQRVITACGTLYPEMIEGIFNAVPQVRRSALVGIGRAPTQWPVVCVELEERTNWQEVHARLCERAATFEPTRRIDRFLPHPGFPVDIRHNAKIGRERLAQWAAKQYPS